MEIYEAENNVESNTILRVIPSNSRNRVKLCNWNWRQAYKIIVNFSIDLSFEMNDELLAIEAAEDDTGKIRPYVMMFGLGPPRNKKNI